MESLNYSVNVLLKNIQTISIFVGIFINILNIL